MPLAAIGLVAVSTKKQIKGVSLDEQERAIRERCAAEGWHLAEIVQLPGVSRSNPDIIQYFLSTDPNHAPYRRLRDAINSHEYAILISYDNGRIARSESFFTYLAWPAVAAGMRVVTIMSGTIDETNADFAIPLAAMSAAGEIKRRVAMTDAAVSRRMSLGLPIRRPPFTHKIIYDDRGKPVRMEVNEEYRTFLETAADLLLDGVGWERMPRLLAARGLLRAGKPWAPSLLRYMFLNPYTWGNAARNFPLRLGIWAFDESVPVPPGVEIDRNPNPPIPPLWTGARAERIQAELRRRTLLRGRARPHTTYMFTGLLVCGVCGGRMIVGLGAQPKNSPTDRRPIYWVCWRIRLNHDLLKGGKCTNGRFVRNDTVIEQINGFLERVLELKLQDMSQLAAGEQDEALTKRNRLMADVARVQQRLANLIRLQSDAPAAAQRTYTEQIVEASTLLESLQAALDDVQAQIESPRASQRRQEGLQEIICDGLAAFWQRSPREINQLLHRAVGNYRFICKDGEIVDFRIV